MIPLLLVALLSLAHADDLSEANASSVNRILGANPVTGQGTYFLDLASDGSAACRVISSALPLGAATAARQDTGNASLASIVSSLPPGVAGVQAYADLTASGVPSDGDTFTVTAGSHVEVITFRTSPSQPNDVLISPSAPADTVTLLGVRFTTAELVATLQSPVVIRVTAGSSFPGTSGNTAIRLQETSGVLAVSHDNGSGYATGGVDASYSTLAKASSQTDGTQKTQVVDGSGAVITSQANGAQRALDVGVNVAGAQVDPRQIRALLSGTDSVSSVQSGPWVANQGQPGPVASPWPVHDAALDVASSTRASESTLSSLLTQFTRAFGAAVKIAGFGDSPAVDAFGRLRVSNPLTVFNSKQIFDNQPLFWDDQQTSGGGTSSVYSQPNASSTLSVGGLTAGTRVRQTRRRFNYQPGKSQLYMFTGVLGAAATGITRRVGAFDAANGVFFEQISTGLRVCVRSSVTGVAVDSCVAQASFNKDVMDGAGSSGVTFLPASAQIFFIDFEWLGTGRVRFGIVRRGLMIVAHEFYGSNESGVSTVWSSTPNFPGRFEISNSGAGAAASLVHICMTVVSEGGQEIIGFSRSVDRGASGFATAAGNNDIYPLVSLRLKSGANLAATVSMLRVSIVNSTNSTFRWGLYLNPTIAGVDAASWVSDNNTSLEYDISRNNTNKVSGGILLGSGYGSDSVNMIVSEIGQQVRLGSTIAGVADQLVLAVQTVGVTTAETYLASVTFSEDL